MTRINLIDVDELYDIYPKFLLAEYREMPRIFSKVMKDGIKLNLIPKRYKLGKGHVHFFTNKLQFLLIRYIKIHYCLKNNGYKLNYSPSELIDKYGNIIFYSGHQIKYKPTLKEIEINYERINDRLSKIKNKRHQNNYITTKLGE